MNWIFLSPHLDDAALSCGGLLSQINRRGEAASIWTICAGDPPSGELSPFAAAQHRTWRLGPDAPVHRRAEDRLACRRLGAAHLHFPFSDCIYRRSSRDGRPLYASESAIFGPLHPEEQELVGAVTRALVDQGVEGARVVCPLGVGGHVDHRLVRAAAEGLGIRLWYYADYPYVRDHASWAESLFPVDWEQGWVPVLFALEPRDLDLWVGAVAAYVSQGPVFWPDEGAMRDELADYGRREGGVRLWRPRK
jgi:LmbE family N-acetylglucosaminyl deacetylase